MRSIREVRPVFLLPTRCRAFLITIRLARFYRSPLALPLLRSLILLHFLSRHACVQSTITLSMFSTCYHTSAVFDSLQRFFVQLAVALVLSSTSCPTFHFFSPTSSCCCAALRPIPKSPHWTTHSEAHLMSPFYILITSDSSDRGTTIYTRTA